MKTEELTSQTDQRAGGTVDPVPRETAVSRGASTSEVSRGPVRNVAVLTGGGDRPYALGLASALIDAGVPFEFIGSDDLESPIFRGNPQAVFRNFRGDQTDSAPWVRKIIRVLRYYARLLNYAVTARPRVFHILWNNKFEAFDRTVLMALYRLCGRRVVFTVHNVNAGNRDGNDSFLNRLTLRIQYSLTEHIFVHTRQMREALKVEFGVPDERSSVIPFGINNTVPETSIDQSGARIRLGLKPDSRVMLFFGNIAPYKGLDCLVQAMALVARKDPRYQLVIAGRLKCSRAYWQAVLESISRLGVDSCTSLHIEYVPDEETELYFKAADVLMLPYKYIFQSGVLFLGYNFGLPVIASDVGSLKEDVVEGETGFVCPPQDPKGLASAIQEYFESDLYRDLAQRRAEIRRFAFERNSWGRVAELTRGVYTRVLDSV